MLHIVNKSPHDSHSLSECLPFIASGDAVLLIEDAVVAAIDGNEANQMIFEIASKAHVWALVADVRARGISRLLKEVKRIDYDGFVELVEDHAKSISWL